MVAQNEFLYCRDEDVADPAKTYVVLDANVLQSITSMGYNGYNGANVEHRRAANLFRWLQRSPCFAVSDSLAILEGAGLHSGRPNPFEMVRRGLYFRGLWSLSGEELENWFSVGGPAIAYAEGEEFEQSLTHVYEDAYASLPWLLGPNYLAVLQMHVNEVEGRSPREGLTAVRDVLLDLNFVSSQAWIAALLHYYGTGSIPNFIRTGLLKLQRGNRRTPVISAAMDLTHLSHLGRLKNEFRAEAGEDLHTVFVTADGALARLHSLIGFGRGSNYVLHENLAKGTLLEMSIVADPLLRARALATPRRPDLTDIERLAKPLEERLEIEPMVWTGLYAPDEHRPDYSLQAALVALYGLRGVELWQAVCQLSTKGDVLFEGLRVAHSMLHGLADKARRDAGSLADVIADSVRRRHGLPMLSIEERLCVAFVKDQTWSGNALLQQVGSFDKDRQPDCVLYVVAYISAVIEFMADLCQLEAHALAGRQTKWLEHRAAAER